jgi:hypothetical protein
MLTGSCQNSPEKLSSVKNNYAFLVNSPVSTELVFVKISEDFPLTFYILPACTQFLPSFLSAFKSPAKHSVLCLLLSHLHPFLLPFLSNPYRRSLSTPLFNPNTPCQSPCLTHPLSPHPTPAPLTLCQCLSMQVPLSDPPPHSDVSPFSPFRNPL